MEPSGSTSHGLRLIVHENRAKGFSNRAMWGSLANSAHIESSVATIFFVQEPTMKHSTMHKHKLISNKVCFPQSDRRLTMTQ